MLVMLPPFSSSTIPTLSSVKLLLMLLSMLPCPPMSMLILLLLLMMSTLALLMLWTLVLKMEVLARKELDLEIANKPLKDIVLNLKSFQRVCLDFYLFSAVFVYQV